MVYAFRKDRSELEPWLIAQTERASRTLVWSTPMEKVAGFAGLYEMQGRWDRPGGVTVHGLGVSRVDSGLIVEAYCYYKAAAALKARHAVAVHIGIPASAVRLVPCAGFVPQVLVPGGRVAHQALAGVGGWGTLGGFASDLTSSLLLAVSNNHVLVSGNAATANDTLVDMATGGPFGDLHRFQPLLPHPAINEVDGAVGRIIEGYDIEPRFRVNGVRIPARGLRVQKVGAASGVTTGRILSLTATASIPYDGVGPVNFRRCLRIEGDNGAFSVPGDSGSLVLDMERRVVGIIFAGERNGRYSLANWATTFTNALGIAF